MSHEITERDIQVATEMAWHGLTKVVKKVTKRNSGLMYDLEMQQLQTPNGIKVPFFSVVAGDDGLPIGYPVSNKYQPIANGEIWDAVEGSLTGIPHEIVSVGSVGNRQFGFMSIDLNGHFDAAGRDTNSVLNILWGHGGVLNVIAKTCFTVVVCGNTFNMALGEKNSEFEFRVKHIGDTEVQLEGMAYAIEQHVTAKDSFRKAMNEFHKRTVSSDEAEQFFAGFIVPDFKGKTPTRSRNMFERLHQLFHDGAGNNGKTVADIFNAATDYYTHEAHGGEENPTRQLYSSEFGTGDLRKQQVFTLLTGDSIRPFGDYESCVNRGKKVVAA